MRLLALAIPAVLAVGGAGYFIAKPKEDPALAAIAKRLEEADRPRPVNVPDGILLSDAERMADAEDTETLAKLANNNDLTEQESTAGVTAASRRYIRRRLAFERIKTDVERGKAQPSLLVAVKQEMDSARRIYDLAESLGRRSRLLASMVRAERFYGSPSLISGLADRHIGSSKLVTPEILAQIEKDFQAEFGKPLPVSTNGASAVHRSMGFDHTGRVDVAVSPENSEGVWLRRYLMGKGFSYFAFRGAVAGQSTGAHIHIGPASGHN